MSESITEPVNIELLKDRFPTEVINPYGEVLVIPSRLFQRGWEPELERQGYKVYAGGFNNESSFFVRLNKPKNVPPSEMATVATTEKSSVKGKKRPWTPEDETKLKEMIQKGMSNREIAKELNRSQIAIQGKVVRMGLVGVRSEPTKTITHVTEPNPAAADQGPITEDMVKEFLSACSLLYPSHKNACAFLLREASNKILEGKK